MKVIHPQNLPGRMPLQSTLIAYLLLDKFHPAQWILGAVGLWFLLLWILYFYRTHKEEFTEVFKDK